MKKCLLVVLMIAILVIAPQISAQDDLSEEELELIDYVAAAFEAIFTHDSVYMAGVQNLSQTITAQGQEIDQVMVQDMSGWLTFNDTEPEGMDMTLIQTISQNMAGQAIDFEMSMDMRLVDEVLYMRIYDLPAELGGFFPEGWINVTEDGDTVPGLEMLNPEQLTNVANSTGMTLPVTEESVLSIEELDSEELDSGEARVFFIVFDTLSFLENEDMREALGMVNVPGVDMDSLMEQMMDGASYEATVWINVEEEILMQIDVEMVVDTEVTMLGQTMDMEQTITNSFAYSDFDGDVEIEVPELD